MQTTPYAHCISVTISKEQRRLLLQTPGMQASRLVMAGAQQPQPAPQDPDRQQQPEGPASAAPAAIRHHHSQPGPPAEALRPSKPPADETAQAASEAPPSTGPAVLQPQQQQQQQQQQPRERKKFQGSAPGERSSGDKRQALQLLREHVASVIEATACLDGVDSNGPECQKVGRQKAGNLG